jgi:hypothetical protein
VPLQKGQISCRELIAGETLIHPLKEHQPVMLDTFDSPYAKNAMLREKIANRGL